LVYDKIKKVNNDDGKCGKDYYLHAQYSKKYKILRYKKSANFILGLPNKMEVILFSNVKFPSMI
jgi:hypothetical protein